MGTVPYEVWHQAALAHLEIDDHVGYRRLCETLRSRHPAKVPEPWVRSALANVCTLGPGGLGEDDKVQTWADDFKASLSTGRAEWKHSALSLQGAILYRSGRFREAIDRFHEGIVAVNGETSFENAALLAMAYQETGNPAKADEWLAKATSKSLDGPDWTSWETQASRLLRREAERLILDRRFPVDPFAR